MNDNLNEQKSTNGGERPPDQTTAAQPQPGRCVFEPLCEAFRKGARDARQAAEQAAPKVKSAAADALYWLTYGVSFAAGFHYHLAKHLSPESLKAGARDGVKASQQAADRFREWWTRPTPQPIRVDSAPTPETPEAPQPGAA